MFTRIFSFLRSLIAIALVLFINGLPVSLFLCFFMLIVNPLQWGWMRNILAWTGLPMSLDGALYVFLGIFLLLPLLLSPLRIMALLVAKCSGWKPARGEDIQIIQDSLKSISLASGQKEKKLHLYIEEDSSLNAAAFGWNNILVTRGSMIAAKDNPWFLQGLLSHELGHLSYGHSLVLFMLLVIEKCGGIAAFILEKANWILVQLSKIGPMAIVCLIPNMVINICFIFVNLLSWLTRQIILLFSRQDEHAADSYACQIGFGEQLLGCMEVLLQQSGSQDEGGFWKNISNDHPSLPHRIETIKKQLAKQNAY